ncbi:hypothetical protein RhiJN_06785 [Ceratobasidium sp. AG-Ba]|nr:hypothetical protein RhiJN_06785 [Ceratobasidium sp. AG-Ba]QRW07702.1 hypothetical protein RhiLY_06701 [Ceratobasidium sp. AG-Ba]
MAHLAPIPVTDYMGSSRHQLFRSAGPHYSLPPGDEIQNIDDDCATVLRSYSIKVIISLNAQPYDQRSLDRLRELDIDYHHYPLMDYAAPDLGQLQEIFDNFEETPENSVALIHCGDGMGRTGTAVSAIQLYLTGGNTDRSVWEDNAVERETQFQVLAHLRRALNPN